jgi:hypothetical protein
VTRSNHDQKHYLSTRVAYELGNLGYDADRLSGKRAALLELVNEAHVVGFSVDEIARLARVARGIVREMLEEAA